MMPIGLSRESQQVLAALKSKNLIPKRLEVAKLGSLFIFNGYDHLNANLISDSVVTGINSVSDIALLKCLSEFVERRTVNTWTKEHQTYALYGTDGAAAYPTLNDRALALERARRHAFHEAIERYAWAYWWDLDNAGAEIEPLDESSVLLAGSLEILRHIQVRTPIRTLWRVQPRLSNHCDTSVEILFAQLQNGGFISGGAAGLTIAPEETIFRALSEMLRHSLAFDRFKKNQIQPITFYERRLIFFASALGDRLVHTRLNRKSRHSLALPPLVLDETLDHDTSDVILGV